jgi:hypothetical protein
MDFIVFLPEKALQGYVAFRWIASTFIWGMEYKNFTAAKACTAKS